MIGSSGYIEHDTIETHPRSMSRTSVLQSGPPDLTHWAPMADSPGPWTSSPSQHGSGPLVKKSRRIEVPVDQNPKYNFVGRILGPRGNSLKRVEAQSGCRVLIRGRGSVKDAEKEEKMREKAGFEHLNEPLHVLVEAELPVKTIDQQLQLACDIIETLLQPEDQFDHVKRAQLRELAALNGTLREESPGPCPSPPFGRGGGNNNNNSNSNSNSNNTNSNTMKRAKTDHSRH